MKLKLISVMLISLLILSFTVSAVKVNPGVTYVSGDIIYGFAWQMNFSVISVNNSWMLFNSTNFTIQGGCGETLNITMQFMHENYSNATYGDSCLQFNAAYNSTGCLTYFNISGFDDHANYSLYNDSVHTQNFYTGVGTWINFTCSDWTGHDFDIKRGQVNASNVTLLRVQARENIPNMISLSGQVTTILGVALIISIILIIIGIMYSAQGGEGEL